MLPLRDSFVLPAPGQAVELRAFTHGLMPRTVPEMMQRFCDDWACYGVDAWNRVPNHWQPDSDEVVGWWSLPEYLGDTFIARLLQAPPGTCILQPNVHWTVQCLLSSPELTVRGDEIVVSETEFPSVLHSVQRWASLIGCEVQMVPATDDGYVDRTALLEAITSKTSLVILSHVGFTSGEKLSSQFLSRVAETCQEAGAFFVVDGYHAIGSVQVNVEELNVDLYVGGLLKEGCGSSGSCFVYLNPRVDLHPRTTGWLGDADPFAFEKAPAPHPSPRRRFLGGTSAVASFYHAVEGIRILLDVGIDTIRSYSLMLTARAIEHIDRADLRLRSPREPERRSAMIILEVPEADRLCTALKREHIYTDSRRGRYLRLAPFVWNTAEEIDRTFEEISNMVATGSYRGVAPEASETGPVT